MTDFAFPQDEGIGTHSSGSGDKNDAANFAATYDAIGKTDYVKNGMAFTVDYATPAVDISAGKAVVTDASATATQTGESRDEGVAFVVETDARTGLSLTDAATNHVFLDLGLTSDDDLTFHIDTDNTPPSQPYLKVGEIDTSADTKSELNRAPSETFESVSTGEASIADRSMVSTSSKTVTVDASGGGDYTSVQTAIDNELPVVVQHNIKFDVIAGDYSDEIIYIPPFITQQQRQGDTSAALGDTREVWIEGDRTTPSNVKVGGIYVSGAYGKRFTITGLQYEDDVPVSDGTSSLQVSNGVVVISDSNFVNTTGDARRAITCYGGGLIVKDGTDLGTNAYDKGIVVKNFGSYTEGAGGPLSGTLNNWAYEFQSVNTAQIDAASTVTSDYKFVKVIRGPVYEFDSSVNRVTHFYIDNDDKRDVSSLYTTGDFDGNFGYSWATRDYSTTSTTYDHDDTQFAPRLTWSEVVPANGQGAVTFQCFVDIGSNTSVDLRLRNLDDSETVYEQTGISSNGAIESGIVTYTPTTTDSRIRLRAQLSTSDGNSATLREPTLQAGRQV